MSTWGMITAGLSALLLGQGPAGGADALKFMQDSADLPDHPRRPERATAASG